MGHIAVPRLDDDVQASDCPFHADCWEGLASGRAMVARWGSPAEALSRATLRRALDVEAHYLAAGLRTIVYALAPERIVLGGGVMAMEGLLPAVQARLAPMLAYPGVPEHRTRGFLVPTALGSRAGSLGALLIAESAASAEIGRLA